MAATGVLLLLCEAVWVEVVDVVDDDFEDLVVVGSNLCVEDQPGSTVKRVPRPTRGEQARMVCKPTASSLEADVEMTHV
jgi:hypothetical protein